MIDASVTNVSADERNDAVIQHKNQSDSKEFVNRGLAKWEMGRKQWLATGISPNNDNPNRVTIKRVRQEGAVNLDVDEIIDCIVSNRWRNAQKGGKDKAMFPSSVPLPQMVDILIDLWEAENL
jgi:hypothetical protein